MYRITAPVKGYTGFGYGLHFANGEAFTDDERLVQRLRLIGYAIAESKPQKAETANATDGDNMITLKAEAAALGLTYHPNIGYEKLLERVNEHKARS